MTPRERESESERERERECERETMLAYHSGHECVIQSDGVVDAVELKEDLHNGLMAMDARPPRAITRGLAHLRQRWRFATHAIDTCVHVCVAGTELLDHARETV